MLYYCAGVFVAYAALTLLFLLFFRRFLPETKSLSLEAITYAFHDDNWGKIVHFSGNDSGGSSSIGRGSGSDDDSFSLLSGSAGGEGEGEGEGRAR